MLQTVCWLMSRRHAVVFARQNVIDLVKRVLNSLIVGGKQIAFVIKRKAHGVSHGHSQRRNDARRVNLNHAASPAVLVGWAVFL